MTWALWYMVAVFARIRWKAYASDLHMLRVICIMRLLARLGKVSRVILPWDLHCRLSESSLLFTTSLLGPISISRHALVGRVYQVINMYSMLHKPVCTCYGLHHIGVAAQHQTKIGLLCVRQSWKGQKGCVTLKFYEHTQNVKTSILNLS